MKWIVSPLELLILPGIFQGIMLSIITFLKGKSKSHTFLAIFLFFLSLQLMPYCDICMAFAMEHPIVIPFFDCIPFILSPSIYLYIHFSFYREYSPKRLTLYHFIPAILNFLFLTILYFLKGKELFLLEMRQTVNGFPPVYMSILFLLRILSAIIYIVLTTGLFLTFRKELKEWKNNPKRRAWFYSLVLSFIFTWAVVVVMGIVVRALEPSQTLLFIRSALYVFCFTMMIYLVTGFSLTFPNILEPKQARGKIKDKLNLTEHQIKLIQEDLARLIEEEEVYLDPNLSLNTLAVKLNIHPNILSFIINEKYPGNFTNFINNYRIEKFITNAKEMDPKVDTFLSLALDAGFSSKSTFNRIFKEIKQVTPSQYLKSNN